MVRFKYPFCFAALLGLVYWLAQDQISIWVLIIGELVCAIWAYQLRDKDAESKSDTKMGDRLGSIFVVSAVIILFLGVVHKELGLESIPFVNDTKHSVMNIFDRNTINR